VNSQGQAEIGVFIAALGGLAVGLERQWSGHASGPGARFAGVRTFTLLGILSGLAGWLWMKESQALAVVLMCGAVALVVAAYVAASRREADATTEVASMVVLASGLAAGIGYWALAGGSIGNNAASG
jgi:MgtC family